GLKSAWYLLLIGMSLEITSKDPSPGSPSIVMVTSSPSPLASPTLQDKQCAGKDFVVLIARLLVVEIFLRYDSFDVHVGASMLGSS
ncbi:hypothetical protein ACJX0J_016754, partial [Zea mays]